MLHGRNFECSIISDYDHIDISAATCDLMPPHLFQPVVGLWRNIGTDIDQTERCKEAQEINAGLLARASESEKQHVAAQVQIAEANRQAMTEVASKFEQQFKHACEVLKDTQQSERQVSQANYEYQKQLTTELLQCRPEAAADVENSKVKVYAQTVVMIYDTMAGVGAKSTDKP
eukprot:gene12772-15098_t